MQLGDLFHQLAARETLFWVAAGALALGAACLAAALILVVRRLGRGVRRLRGSPPAATAPRVPAILAVERYAAPTPAAAPDTGEEPSLALLLRRLQSVGDRLEVVAGDLEAMRADGEESGLKDALPGVEYVYRASGA